MVGGSAALSVPLVHPTRELRAPAMCHATGAGRWVPGMAIAVALAGLAAWGGWAATGSGPSTRSAACGGLLWAVCTAVAWRALARWPSGLLAWDGLEWCLDRARALPDIRGRLDVALDLQRFLLVRLVDAQGRAWWLALEPGRSTAEWLALRRAVYSRPRREPTAEGDKTPPAHRPDA